jgi:hypothetical protein
MARPSRRTATTRVLASLSLAAAAAGEWTLCDPTNTAYNSTRCPPWATCMANDYSLSSWGCAPFPNATVCLGSHFQACPANSACVLANGSGNATDLHNVYNCVAPGTGASLGKSRCSCKPGAPLPPSPTLKNALIIGDSISLGYTPFLAAALADVALIQHAPWSSDGGSEETAYTLQCALPFWLSSPGGEPIAWDLVYAQSGMHNSGQGAEWIVPGQSGEPAAYAAELYALLASLKARAPLVFGVTSPMMCNATIDAVISSTLNPAARLIAAELALPTVDLYAAVTDACGPVPQAACFGQAGGFCPHSNDAGYSYLASVIAPVLRAALGA